MDLIGRWTHDEQIELSNIYVGKTHCPTAVLLYPHSSYICFILEQNHAQDILYVNE